MCFDVHFGLTRIWSVGRCAAALLLTAGTGIPVSAQTEVDLQLVLAVDATGSVNQYRFELQKRGYLTALRDPRLLTAVLGGRKQSVAINLFQWSGPSLQIQVLPWTLLKDESSILSAATTIEQTPRKLFGGNTSISGAIDYSVALFSQSPFQSKRRVIDISGDGANNTGRSVAQARNDAVGKDITINGLPILAVEPNLDQYYRDYVIGGPAAFMVVAETFEHFADAILKKMIVEVGAPTSNR